MNFYMACTESAYSHPGGGLVDPATMVTAEAFLRREGRDGPTTHPGALATPSSMALPGHRNSETVYVEKWPPLPSAAYTSVRQVKVLAAWGCRRSICEVSQVK